MGYQQEFGQDFDLGLQLPNGARDCSYRHDVCPRFEWPCVRRSGCTIVLWIDYPLPIQRDHTEHFRYTIEYGSQHLRRTILETNCSITVTQHIHKLLTAETTPTPT